MQTDLSWRLVQSADESTVDLNLSDRGIQLSDGGKGKRKAELEEFCRNAEARKQSKLDEVVESCRIVRSAVSGIVDIVAD